MSDTEQSFGEDDFDAIVVGAGPAGCSAALALARAGKSVLLLERGPFPGSKNVYGGVVYGRILDEIIPQWWDEVPVQRWVTKRSTMILTPTQSVSIDFRTQAWGQAPYNGMTVYRAEFDSWLAQHAVDAGAVLITSTVATGLLRGPAGEVVGIRTDRDGGELRTKIVIACDGVNSFLAKEAGLMPRTDPDNLTLGVKEVLALDPEVISERFGVGPHEGVDIEMLGSTRGIPGGGFLYTNSDSISLGVVVSVAGLAKAKVRPEELIEDLKSNPAIAPYVKGATLREYSAHLIPEGGYDAMPTMVAAGLLVAGDAAGLCLAAGLFLEGVNFAIGSGLAAARAAIKAIDNKDFSAAELASYTEDLKSNFVLADHKRLRAAPHLVLSERVQQKYPGLIADLVQGLFTVENPTPKPGLVKLLRGSAKKHDVKLRHLLSDAVRGGQTFR